MNSAISGGGIPPSGGTITGPLLAADGSTSVPSYSFSNYPTFGLYAASGVLGEAMGTGQINFTGTTAAPTALTGTIAAGAGVDAGTHSYKVTYVTAGGETDAGAVSNTVTTAGGNLQVNITGLPVSASPFVTSRKIYRTAAGNAAVGPWLLQQTIANNTATTATDNTADAALTTTIPTTNTAIDTRLTLANNGNLTLGSASSLLWSTDLIQTRRGAANLNLGAADVDTNASIVAQSLSVQSALAGGTSDQAGKDFTINGSQGKGTGAGGQIVFKAAGAGNTGTVVNALNTVLTLKDAGTAGTSKPQAVFTAGTSASPSITFNTNDGFYNRSAGTGVTFVASGTDEAEANGGGFLVRGGSGLVMGMSNGSPSNGFSAGFSYKGAGNVRLGASDAAVPVAQTFSSQGSRGGTDTDTAAPAGGTTFVAPLGTGLAAGDQLNLSRGLMGVTGTTAHAAAHAFTVCESKTLSNTSATTTTIATINLPSNSAGGFSAVITVTATDGTNFDSETQTVNVSYVNKAGVITVGTPVITASTAANNSGSATIGATVTGASPTISLKVTPVFTTIVPTTVTVYATITNNGTGNVTAL